MEIIIVSIVTVSFGLYLIFGFKFAYRKIRDIRNEKISRLLQRPLVEKFSRVEKSLTEVQNKLQELESTKDQLTIVYESIKEILPKLTIAEVMPIFETIFVRMLGLKYCAFFVSSAGGYKNIHSVNLNSEMKSYLNYFQKEKQEFIKHLTTFHIIYISEEWQFLRNIKQTNLKMCIVIPIIEYNEVLGAIVSFVQKDEALKDTILANALVASKQIALGLKKIMLYEEVKELSMRDGLTKLYLHRVFKQKLQEELDRASRYKLNLSLLMLDIDHFKKINDTYGHLIGDNILEHISKIILKNISPVMVAARYGGEEFAIICPNYKEDEAFNLAEKIRTGIANTEFNVDSLTLKLTISIGGTAIRDGMVTVDIEEFINQADTALYKAKNEGRNRVCMYNLAQG